MLIVYQATRHPQSLSVLCFCCFCCCFGQALGRPCQGFLAGSWQCYRLTLLSLAMQGAENRTTLSHWEKHFYTCTAAQSISTVMEIRQGANRLCWSQKKKLVCCFWLLFGHLQYPGYSHTWKKCCLPRKTKPHLRNFHSSRKLLFKQISWIIQDQTYQTMVECQVILLGREICSYFVFNWLLFAVILFIFWFEKASLCWRQMCSVVVLPLELSNSTQWI